MSTIANMLKRTFKENLNADTNNMSEISKHTGMSPKKLQRLLKDEGTTYTKVLETYRIETAETLLSQSDLPINKVAHKLGYSSTEAFNTACKRWVGVSPRNHRNNLLNK